MAELQQGVDDAANTIEHGKLLGKVLGIGGILVTGLVAGISDYSQHQNLGRAAVVGGLHAGLSWAGAAAGGAFGGAVGGLIGGPVGFVVGSFLGASAGGFLGDLAATGIANFADSGFVQNAWNTYTSDVSNVANGLANAWNSWSSSWSW